jgi:hypothetical protein
MFEIMENIDLNEWEYENGGLWNMRNYKKKLRNLNLITEYISGSVQTISNYLSDI